MSPVIEVAIGIAAGLILFRRVIAPLMKLIAMLVVVAVFLFMASVFGLVTIPF